MPPPDDTYYNLKRLHVVFAVSSLALLAATVWMVAADHWREWKVYQRTFRDQIAPWLTEARIRVAHTEELAAREKKLSQALAKAREAVPGRDLIQRFCEELRREASRREVDQPDVAGVEAAYEALAGQPSVEARDKLLNRLGRWLAAAANRRKGVDRQLRFRRAEFAEARTCYEAAIGEGVSQAKLERLEERVDRAKGELDLSAARSEAALANYEALKGILGEITRQEQEAQKALADERAAVARLERALAEQRPNLGKRFLRLPLIDAFGRPLAIDQIWLPELTIDYNFRPAARFDRCVTCHQGIDRTGPSSASEPACLRDEVLTVQLPMLDQTLGQKGPEAVDAESGSEGALESALRDLFGLGLAPQGILEADAPTIGLVLPRTPAADADLRVGDVIQEIDQVEITGRDAAIRSLAEAIQREKGQPSQEDEAAEDADRPNALRLRIRRGLPHPYSSHPRMDLFVGSLSPHPKSVFGCTICHGGQGSATEFKFASHTPNDPQQRLRWRKEHGWFWNEHWDFPMRPARFVQSSCLKCHHDVTDLAPNDRFPDPPAPKLLEGYQLVRQNGCFGCHEIRGVTASGRRVGPDMRLEPDYHEAALQLLARADLTDHQRSLARQVVTRPESPNPRRQLAASLPAGGAATGSGGSGRLKPASAAALQMLAAKDPAPGTMRKVGPPLRDVAGKLDAVFSDAWLRDTTAFRPNTRMPQFYGLHEHLDGKGLEDAKRYEAVEIRAVTDYLLAVSQPVKPLPAPSEVTEPPSAQRGKRLFLTQGCLACHQHEDFPEAESVFGPDLSGLGAKLSTDAGREWLVSWIRDPARHAPRTLMPNTLLEPVPLAGSEEDEADGGNAENERAGQGGGGRQAPPRMTDPAADVAAYLLDSAQTDKPPQTRQPLVEADLDELVLLHLGKSFSKIRAEQYLKGAIELTVEEAQGDAIELLGRVTRQKKIRYVGRRTIGKRGCYGCHDVPGFEGAQPIGPALSDWGRKQTSLLAFEQIHRWVAKEDTPEGGGSGADSGSGAEADPGRGFYIEALLAQRREGFIWQKLRAPRSFDYKKTENKGYNERLTMGRFSLTPAQREAIITFVLGLVADPPASKYVWKGDRRRQAIVEGGKVLDRYGCAECHTMEMARWSIQYDPEEIEGPYQIEDFAFMKPHVDARKLDAQPDRRGLVHAEAVGRPQRDELGDVVEDIDDDDYPLYFFNLWEPLPIRVQTDWAVWSVGGAQIEVSDPHQIVVRPADASTSRRVGAAPAWVRPTYTAHLTATRPAVGGAFARLLFPHVLSDESPAVMEGWGWVPPPLVREGAKVQPAWLHDYLSEPFLIRPAAVLRMPKSTMSPEETGKLVDYFAAASGVEFPYSSDPRTRSAPLEPKELERPGRLDDAMRIVIDRTTFCTKCHLIGDFSPGGEVRTVLAPRLDQVARRLRPEYLRRWLANPKAALPYTAMPVNFPPTGPPLGQDLFEGESVEQIDAVTDLLLNYDWYLGRRTSVRAMMGAAENTPPDGTPEGN